MNLNNNVKVMVILVIICVLLIKIDECHYFCKSYSLGLEPPQSKEEPVINDPSLKSEMVAEGLELPTAMAFMDENDILVLEKEKGTVMRITNGILSEKPLLDLNVGTEIDRGLLGISVLKSNIGKTFVFLYFTETRTKDGEDETEGVDPIGNRLYRYELQNNKLVHPKLLLDLPVSPNHHPGGQIKFDNDGHLYIVIGDIDHYTKVQNIKNDLDVEGTSGILRITQDGKAIGNGILGGTYPLNLYYAYGIRNSFGMDFDPVTGKLWDTENGPDFGDEINLVEPGFNSGWREIQGIWTGYEKENTNKTRLSSSDLNLVNFEGKGKYSEPELTWYKSVGLTALKFLKSDKLGKAYENDMFVGDFNNGYLYHFDLNERRTDLSLDGLLGDRVVDNASELAGRVIGQIFGGISDIEVGPDGFLYVISIGQGKIFRIVPL